MTQDLLLLSILSISQSKKQTPAIQTSSHGLMSHIYNLNIEHISQP